MPISNIIILRILNCLRKETDHNEDEIDMVRFSLEVILAYNHRQGFYNG